MLSETQLQSFEIQLKTVGSVVSGSLEQISSASSWNWHFHWEFSEITNINCWCSFSTGVASEMPFATCFVDKCEQYLYLSVQFRLLGILSSPKLVKRVLFWGKDSACTGISLLDLCKFISLPSCTAQLESNLKIIQLEKTSKIFKCNLWPKGFQACLRKKKEIKIPEKPEQQQQW